MSRKHLITTFALVLLSAVTCFAQQEGGPGGPGGQGGQGGPPPDFNPQAMRQRMMDRMRDRLGATADEWKVLSPKIEQIMTAQRDLRGGGGPGGPGGGGGFGGPPSQGQGQGQGGPRGDGGDRGPRPQRGGNDRGGPPQDGGAQGGPGGGPPPQDQPQPSAVAQARQNLREAVDDPNINADELAKLVKTYREARDQAKENLAKSQKDLKDLVTPKQEAFFVSMGLLD